MTDLSTKSTIAPLALARLTAELLTIRKQLAANEVGALERVRLAARGLQIRALLGAKAPAAAPAEEEPKPLATSMRTQKNGAVLVTGNPADLAAYAAQNFDGLKVTETADGILLPKSKANLASFIPASSMTLPSGAVVYEHNGGGVSIWYQGYASGMARDVSDLKNILAREWGPEKYQAAFGEEADPEDVQAYQEEQQAIADRKSANAAAEADRAAAAELERQQAADEAKAAAEEAERIRREREAESRADFDKTIGAGISSNPVYQAFLDTLEQLPTFEEGNAAFLGWAGIRAGEFEQKVKGRVSQNRSEYLEYLREYAEAHLSERVRAQREPTGGDIALTGTEFGEFPDTPEGKKQLRAAAKAFLEGMRGQLVDCPALGGKVEIRQRGIKETMAFSGNPKKLKLLHAVPQIIGQATVAERSENHKRDKKTTVEAYFYLKTTVSLAGEPIAVRVVVEQDLSGQLYYDLLVDPPKEMAMLDASGCSPDHNSGHPPAADIATGASVEHGASGVMLDDAGQMVLNLFLEGEEIQVAAAPVRVLPPEWNDKLLAAAESTDVVLPDDVRAKLAAREGVFENASMRGEPSEAEIAEQVEALKVAQMGRGVERAAIAKYEQRFQEGVSKAVESWAIGWTLSAISARKSREAPDGTQPNGEYGKRAQQYMTGAKQETATARSDAAFLEALKRRNPSVEQEPQQEPTVEPAEVPGPAPEIIEYKTRKGKVLRGIIRTDLTKDQAQAIDPYTWRMGGGYFIREKHLRGETAHIQAAPAPVVLTAEQQAEAQATAQRQAEERARAALASQVEKLRQVANKAIGDADSSLGADRKTNTAKRAREAGYALEKAAANKAVGETLNRLADAIEIGAGGVLAKLSSRAQLEELNSIMRMASYDADMKQEARSRYARDGRPFEENDIKFLKMPRAFAWDTAFSKAAKTLATQSAKGNSRLIAALAKLGNGPERNYLDASAIAITRKAYAELKKVKGEWDLANAMESIARVDRLARMGVTDAASLEAAVRALIPHQVEKAKEDPVKVAERAIVGQNVGIDFFPTPAHVAQRMARLAHIKEGMRVLEPSAGNGNLADAAKAQGGVVDVIEIADRLRDILTAKGYSVVAHDFDGFTPDEKYPAILMNPPFSNRRDAAHIMRAFDMLASGGTLVAIAGEGVFFGKDKQAEAFRQWLDAHSAEVEPLEGGTFQDNALLAQTSANARLIVLRK